MREREERTPTLGGPPQLPGISIGTEPPLAQHNLIDRALSSFGRPSLEAVQAAQRGEATPRDVAWEFLTNGPMGPFGMMAGRIARTADHAALRRAETMARDGQGRDDIWRDTGWFQGRDGQWRFEIDDSAARVSMGVGTAQERIDHPGLHAAYPDLGSMPMSVSDTMRVLGSGEFSPSFGLRARGADDVQRTATGLHEAQHFIQRSEGFSPGGNPRLARDSRPPEDVAALRQQYSDEARRLMTDGADLIRADRYDEGYALQARSRALSDLADSMTMTGSGPYRRLAGEVEARNVETRASMSPAERRAKPPWQTQDVPDEQQLLSPFNPEIIEILRRYGIVAPPAGAALAAGLSDETGQ